MTPSTRSGYALAPTVGRAAAFFDLDRTLLRRSSALALAGSFREYGVISRTQLAKAAFWQLLFVARGASAETVRKAAEDGLMLLRGFSPDEMRRARRRRARARAAAARLPRAARPRAPAPRARRARLHRLGGAAGDRGRARRRPRLRRRARDDLRGGGRRLHRPVGALAARRGQGGRRARAGRARGHRSRRVDRVLGQPQRPAVPRGRRQPGRRQPRPRAARGVAPRRGGWPVLRFAERALSRLARAA